VREGENEEGITGRVQVHALCAIACGVEWSSCVVFALASLRATQEVICAAACQSNAANVVVKVPQLLNTSNSTYKHYNLLSFFVLHVTQHPQDGIIRSNCIGIQLSGIPTNEGSFTEQG